MALTASYEPSSLDNGTLAMQQFVWARRFEEPGHSAAGTISEVPRPYETLPSWDSTVGLYLGSFGGLKEGSISYERGTSVPYTLHASLRTV
jgi:hypothetical protein